MATVKDKSQIPDNVVMVLKDALTGQVMGFDHGHNTVSQDGLNYLAQLFMDGTQTMTLMSQSQIQVATLVIHDTGISANRSWYSLAALGIRSMDTGWPMINGSDSGNNPGVFATDITTFKTTFAAAQAIGDIVGVALAPPFAAASGVSTNIFNWFTLSTPRQKTALDLLSVYVGIQFSIP
jgi:hypothetical protein